MSDKATNNGNGSPQKEHRILSTKQAMIYSLPLGGLQAVIGMMGFFAILFYTNIMGAPAIFTGLIYSGGLYLEAFLSIFFGVFSDNIKSRIGGKKTIILLSIPIISLSTILLWVPPIPPSSVVFGAFYPPLLTWMLLFILFFRIADAGYWACYNALLPELSTDEKNRVKISMIGMLITLVGIILGILGPMIIMGDVTEDLPRNDPQLYIHGANGAIAQEIASGVFVFTIFFNILFIIFIALMLLFTKEPSKPSRERPSISQIFSDITGPLKDKNFRNYLISFFLSWTPIVSLSYLLMNIATYLLELRGSEFVIFMVVALCAGLFAFVFSQKLSAKYGIKKTLRICLSITLIPFVSIFIILFPLDHALTVVIGMALVSLCLIGFVGAMIFPATIMSAIVDEAEKNSQKSLSGSYAGAYSMVLTGGSATSMLIVSLFLEIFGAEAKISYVGFFLFGAVLLTLSLFIFRKVRISNDEVI